MSSNYPQTSIYLKKYFSASVMLPSDWIMIANLFQTLETKLPKGSLPTALRKVMKERFGGFDEYQLAKYNKSLKGPNMEDLTLMDEDERQEILRGRDFDLKRLVRLLHISDPGHLVMAIVGKKYPDNQEQFRQSRIDGVYDPMMAGKRMKLKTPITWETQISLKGKC